MVTKNLYRGKSAVDGQMVYGSLLITEIGGKDIYCIIPRASFTEFVNKLVSPRYNVWTKSGAANNYYIIQVDPETVGQYIGINDINDRKIFEGDIVKGIAYSMEWIGVIVWIEEIASFGLYHGHDIACENCSILKRASRGMKDEFAAEIIGNIHDNPDLLKVEVADD